MELIKQEHQLPVLRPPESGDPIAIGLQTARQSVLIKNATVEQVKEVLRLVMIKIGLRAQNWPTDEEKLVLIEHVISSYGGHTTKEIKLAFDMAIAGKLETEANCYENFSCLYFSNIMNAYRLWAREEFKILQVPDKKPLQIEYEKMTDDEFIEMNSSIWRTLKIPGIIRNPSRCYSILVAKNKIKLTQEEKDKMYSNVEVVLKLKMNSEKSWHDELFPIWQNKEKWTVRVFSECKRKAVESYFNTL